MKFSVSLIFVIILSSCEAKDWWIKINNTLDSLNKNYFDQANYGDVTKLDIHPARGYRPKHSKIERFDFLQKFPNLVALWIVFFKFDTFEKIEFSTKLKELGLYKGKLKKLQKNQFQLLENLVDLDLSSNEIEVLSEDDLKYNKKLKQINFELNKIRKLPKKFFCGLYELEKVVFYSNQLKFLDSFIFQDNKKLKWVDFQDNRIQMLNPEIFVGLTSLKVNRFYKNPCVNGTGFIHNSDLENCFKNWTDDNKNCARFRPSGSHLSGRKFPRSKHPWAVVIFCQQSFKRCGGSLISKKHILTSAHCFQYKDEKNVMSPSECSFFINKPGFKARERDVLKLEVSELILHPHWDHYSLTWDADLAIAVLETKILYSTRIKPLCLNNRSIINFHGQTATVIGWKMGNELFAPDGKLLETDVNLVDPETCHSNERELKKYVGEEESFICTGNQTDPCIGNSGNALFIKAPNDTYYGIGIVSMSLRDESEECDTSRYQHYIIIAHYHEWIEEVVVETY